MTISEAKNHSAAANSATTVANDKNTSTSHSKAAAIHKMASEAHGLAGNDEMKDAHADLANQHTSSAERCKAAEGNKVGIPAVVKPNPDATALVGDANAAKDAAASQAALSAATGYGACPKCGDTESDKTSRTRGGKNSTTTCGACGVTTKSGDWDTAPAKAKNAKTSTALTAACSALSVRRMAKSAALQARSVEKKK